MEAIMSSPADDRRRTPRHHSVDGHGIVSARVRPGRDASVIDVSAAGALVETTHRLLPGTDVDLHLETSRGRATVRGRVLRCAVSCLRSASVCYRGAIAFDRHLPWFADEGRPGYGVPAQESRPGHGRGARTTQTIL
jgi:hypothetical protein